MPSSRKRRRAASPAEDGNARPPSLDGFRLLPAEIKQHIVNLACCASSSLPLPPDSHSIFATDTATALSLCLASRELGQLAQAPLYYSIIITRPSALYFLHRTLKAQPHLAKFTRRLHLGPLDALPEGWWPLSRAYADGEGWSPKDNRYLGRPFTWLKTTLSQAELPSGYEPGHAWAFRRALPGCREAAISDALQAAQDFLEVDAYQEGQRPNSAKLTSILELQAALDLYLEGVRGMEEYDEKLQRLARPGARTPLACRNGSCKHYMSLDILGAPQRRHSSCRTWPLGGQHQMSRLAMLRHLARPGAVTDRFDHPLVFARSGFEVNVSPPLGRGYADYVPGQSAYYVIRNDSWDVDETHEWPDLAALQKDQREWEREGPYESDEDKEWSRGMITKNELPINTGTLGQTLRLARSVLALFVELEDISVTGYLSEALENGHDEDRLRKLSFGPTPPFWDWDVGLPLAGLPNLEKLHLCGVVMSEDELIHITNAMPRLKEFQWSMFDEASSGYELDPVGAVKLLLHRETRLLAGEGPSKPQGDDAVEDDDNDNSRAEDQKQPRQLISGGNSESPPIDGAKQEQQETECFPNDAFIIVKLHPQDVIKVLAAAPSGEVREAWRTGRRSANGQRRLLVQDNVAAWQGPEQLWFSGDSSGWNKIYDAGRQWWRGEDGVDSARRQQ